MSKHVSSPSKLKLALICGGPSLERGISLNSARSLLDHLSGESIEISVFYINQKKEWYAISPFQLYSNTPADFDFKLNDIGQYLEGEGLLKALKEVDLVFPTIHGVFGEDGELQSFLEDHGVPFVGPSSAMCQNMFHKKKAALFLEKHGFHTLDSCLLDKGDPKNLQKIMAFFKKNNLKRAVVKPVAGGSSIGVFSVSTSEEALKQSLSIFEHPLNTQVLLEPFCKGREFTVVVLQNPQGQPVALIPNEIQISYEDGQLFDYRRKYLPTNNTKWLCPPSFKDEVVKLIQKRAEDLFSLFELVDFVRMDGWLLDDGEVLFTDFNPISGMEQNSFLFLQAAYVGMKHQEVLAYIIRNTCQRYKIKPPLLEEKRSSDRFPVWVVFGGYTAERQVSVMSGTNVWLKLMRSERYLPKPFFLDPKGHLWHLPYVYCLHHTVEEIYENCLTSHTTFVRLSSYVTSIRQRLGLRAQSKEEVHDLPQRCTFEKFKEEAFKEKAFVFLGLHGGPGEDGVFQEQLTEAKILYNGSGPEASELCMDKFFTGQAIERMGDEALKSLPKHVVRVQTFEGFTEMDYENYWNTLSVKLGTPPFIIKPKDDGCSAGVVRLKNSNELKKYVMLVGENVSCIPLNTFLDQKSIIELNPGAAQSDYLLEPFIEADFLEIKDNKLVHTLREGWLEITVGILEDKGVYYAMNPSLTIAEGHVLNVEEKFQGGTGVNITPPPTSLIPPELLEKLKRDIEKTALALGIQNYARIDCFFNTKTAETIIIEANSLPALTPSTVLYHQGLAETKPLSPRVLLEKIIDSKRFLE